MSLVSHYPENMELLESINIYFIPNLQAPKRFTPLILSPSTWLFFTVRSLFIKLGSFLADKYVKNWPANPFGGTQLKMLEFFSLVYFWNLKINVVGTALSFVHAFFRYEAIKDSPWYAKVFIALILSWGFALVVFLGRVCLEILNNVSLPTLDQINETIKELDK